MLSMVSILSILSMLSCCHAVMLSKLLLCKYSDVHMYVPEEGGAGGRGWRMEDGG